MNNPELVSRRVFLKHFGIVGTTCLSSSALFSGCLNETPHALPLNIPEHTNLEILDDFQRPNTEYIGDKWESLNPGYWRIESNSLRRNLLPDDDPIEIDWYPWHWETHFNRAMPLEFDSSLPFGMIWRRDWQLSGNYYIQADFQISKLPKYSSSSSHKQSNPGYACMGLGFGSSCLHESGTGSQSSTNSSILRALGNGNVGSEASWMLLVTDDGRFGIYSHATDELIPVAKHAEVDIGKIPPNSMGSLGLYVWGSDNQYATVTGILSINDSVYTIQLDSVNRIAYTNGYLGLVARGQIDFKYNHIALDAGENFSLETPINDLHCCYPLGDTLRQESDGWHCTFVALFRSSGNEVAIRVSDQELTESQWAVTRVNGAANIVSNDYRLNSAIIDVTLPFPPNERTMYFTVWKDGVDVTSDPRIGSTSIGEGTGFMGQVPESGNYTGRLPRLTSPYKICGISSRSIHENPNPLLSTSRYEPWFISDQPTQDAFQHLEEYNFQIMLWEDGIWQLASLSPPSTKADAYKIICTSIAGPTTRWQMMRHWNVLNPGGAEYGMEDTKGPEQFLMRTRSDLGQDIDYMQRNFQIVQHLCMGNENPKATENPKNWRRWRMPARDLSIYILDSRSWRTSQDTNIWDDEGWGEKENLYSRSSPSRALLGEEQFSWLQQKIKTDSSTQICITGINGLHTIWAGVKEVHDTNAHFSQRDRVVANYAGWVEEGANRILELLGSRDGIISLYGGSSNACILLNEEQRLCECCFGPTGLNKEQALITDSPFSRDADGRPIQMLAYYGREIHTPNLLPNDGPFYWNFMDITLQPDSNTPVIGLVIRNIIDSPTQFPRGGNKINIRSLDTGRQASSILPRISLIPDADVQISSLEGEPIRGTRTGPDGTINYTKLVDIKSGTPLLVTAYSSNNSTSRIINTLPIPSNTEA